MYGALLCPRNAYYRNFQPKYGLNEMTKCIYAESIREQLLLQKKKNVLRTYNNEFAAVLLYLLA